MEIKSSAFLNNRPIPTEYTCDGENVNPPLEFNGVPQETKSLVLIVDDPDSPTGIWTHWIVWNISPNTKKIARNSVPPDAMEAVTDFGNRGYGGPCPGSGVHHYFFRIIALDAKLDLTESAKSSDIEKTIKGHILDQSQIIGTYERQPR